MDRLSEDIAGWDVRITNHDHKDNPFYQYLPFDETHIEFVLAAWRDAGRPNSALGYLNPEVATITPDTIAAARRHRLGINSWGLFEEWSADRGELYRRIASDCGAMGVPFTAITDYAQDNTAMATPGAPATSSGRSWLPYRLISLAQAATSVPTLRRQSC